MKKLEKIMKAFGNISRLKIVKHLKAHTSASVVDISRNTKCSYKATSKHLSILFRVDVVDRQQSMYEMHYRIADSLDPSAKAIIELI
ncbi:MAG: ArsR family transcriptional regulator [bacterium]|nr:ArsR family transcriptional regulator [bacterium]